MFNRRFALEMRDLIGQLGFFSWGTQARTHPHAAVGGPGWPLPDPPWRGIPRGGAEDSDPEGLSPRLPVFALDLAHWV